MELTGYFLVVWDFIRYAVDHHIPVGPGRFGGRLLRLLLHGHHGHRPPRYDLLFERFLNPGAHLHARHRHRLLHARTGEVINYVTEKYGRENVAQIITFGEMKARLAIRDVGRALGVPLDKVDKMAKNVPEDLGVKIEQALLSSAPLKAMYDSDPEVREVLDVAKRLEGLTRHASTRGRGGHRSMPITEYCPLHKGAAAKRTSPRSSARRRSRTWACSKWTSSGSRP